MMYSRFLLTVFCILSLVACGGGSQNSTVAPSTTTYLAAATAGELIKYTIDTDKLTYEYEIKDSVYGLSGIKRTGNLIKNSDGTYAQDQITNSLMKVTNSGVIVSAIQENLQTPNQYSMTFGAKDIINDNSLIAGVYNYFSKSCSIVFDGSTLCAGTYGTVEFKNNGSWQQCEHGNLTNNPDPLNSTWIEPISGSSTLTCPFYDFGTYSWNGTSWDLYSTVKATRNDQGVNNQIIGSAMISRTDDGNILSIDIRDQRPWLRNTAVPSTMTYQKTWGSAGIVLGLKQTTISPQFNWSGSEIEINALGGITHRSYAADGSFSRTDITNPSTVLPTFNKPFPGVIYYNNGRMEIPLMSEKIILAMTASFPYPLAVGIK